MHLTKDSTIAQCLFDRLSYGKNPEKTENGELISAFSCDPRTADAEFLLSKKRYEQITGRYESSNVIAYQVRQSFKPREVTPQEANQIGYEFASRFLKGKHAFLVCTHTDKEHIHNHIYWNSTTLDCTRKFRDFHRSGMAVRKLSDLICVEHQLSVIADPQRHGKSYNRWLGTNAKLSQREILRTAIDTALHAKPNDFDEFLSLLVKTGFNVENGKNITIKHHSFKNGIRMNTLGEGYTENELRAVINGQKAHYPKKRRTSQNVQLPQTIIDIQAKLAEGKGEGYRKWATVENLKRMAKTKLYMDEHGLDYNGLAERKAILAQKEADLLHKMKQVQERLDEISALKTHIINYAKTKDIYVDYIRSGHSESFFIEHEADIIMHKAAKKDFDESNVKKLPTIKNLNMEFSKLLKAKKEAYTEVKKLREEMKTLAICKSNHEELACLKINEKQLSFHCKVLV